MYIYFLRNLKFLSISLSNKSFIITNFNSDQFKTIKDDSDILKKTHEVLFNIKKKPKI